LREEKMGWGREGMGRKWGGEEVDNMKEAETGK
jgi:hypothetical protein